MKKIIAFFLFFMFFAPSVIIFAQNIQEGNATWYEDSSRDLHASHAQLPPGTRLRVTNLNNQKEVYVTVTDRIQNSGNRILDVSQAAASLLDMNKRGSTPVRLVVIRGLVPEPTPAAPSRAAVTPRDRPVPEITAISVSPDDEEFEDDYDYYKDDHDSYGGYAEETSPMEAASVEPPPPIRAFSRQPAPQVQPGPSAPPAAGSGEQVLLKKIVVLINGKEQTIDIPDGVYIPLPSAGQTPPTPAYTPPASSRPAPASPPVPSPPAPSRPTPAYPTSPPPPVRTMPVPPPVQGAEAVVIRIIPKLPDPYSGKVYRVQVAAYSRVALAQVCFDRLKAAGFSPAYEQNGSLYRVVISGIRAADISSAAQRLTAAGFTEAWIREESQY